MTRKTLLTIVPFTLLIMNDNQIDKQTNSDIALKSDDEMGKELHGLVLNAWQDVEQTIRSNQTLKGKELNPYVYKPSSLGHG